MCYAPIMGVGGIIFALQKSVSLSWIIALAVIVLLGLVIVLLNVAMPKFKSLQRLTDRLNLVSRENLSGMLVVRAFTNEKFEEARFDKANEDLTRTNRFTQRVMSITMPIMMLIMNLVTLLIMWVGGHAIAESTMQVGDMMAYIQYTMQIIMSFLMISMIFIMVPRAMVSADRVQEVLTTELSIKEPENPVTLGNESGELRFDDVSFRYGNAEEDTLSHISFTAKPGQTTAFIGATGAGKSTLGIPGVQPDHVVGVLKAYSTCVGAGPFVAENAMPEEWKESLRKAGGEYGAATGRPRRVGPFDAVASRYGLKCQRADKIALTKLDVLSYMQEIPIITGYLYKGKETDTFVPTENLEEYQPVISFIPGWKQDISACRRWEELPDAAKNYIKTLEKLLDHEIQFISVGAKREEYLIKGEWL